MNRVKIRQWYWALLVFAVAVAVGFGFLAVKDVRSRVQEQSLADVRARIERLRVLSTASFRYRDIVYYDQRTRILGLPAGQQEVLFAVEMDVRAGVDLSRGFTVSIDGDRRRALVTLPQPEVLRVDADEASIRQYLVRERLGRLDWLDVSEEVEAAKERNRGDAVSRGLLDRARTQSERVIRGLLMEAGFPSVEIRFRPTPEEIRG
mgnify:CR=1 FL=1